MTCSRSDIRWRVLFVISRRLGALLPHYSFKSVGLSKEVLRRCVFTDSRLRRFRRWWRVHAPSLAAARFSFHPCLPFFDTWPRVGERLPVLGKGIGVKTRENKSVMDST